MLLKSLGACSFVGAIVISGSLYAAVPETIIQGWRDNAQEALDLTVLSKDETTQTRPYGSLPGNSVITTSVTLTAKVDVIHRTATGLAQGSVIVIQYEITRYQPPPGPPDGVRGVILNVGEGAAAYLTRASGKLFHLACVTGCLVKL